MTPTQCPKSRIPARIVAFECLCRLHVTRPELMDRASA